MEKAAGGASKNDPILATAHATIVLSYLAGKGGKPSPIFTHLALIFTHHAGTHALIQPDHT